MLPEARRYAFIALRNNPRLMREITRGIGPDNPFWDFRPDPDRFSMRFVLAHVADWDPIFLGRVEQITTLDQPELPAYDEGRMAIDNAYASQNPHDNLVRWESNREVLIEKFSSIPVEQHDRVGLRPGQGLISIADYMAMVTLHDSYHLSQALEYKQTWLAQD